MRIRWEKFLFTLLHFLRHVLWQLERPMARHPFPIQEPHLWTETTAFHVKKAFRAAVLQGSILRRAAADCSCGTGGSTWN